MVKKLTINTVWQRIVNVFSRFPLTSFIAIFGTLILMAFMHLEANYWDGWEGVYRENLKEVADILLPYGILAVFAWPLSLAYDLFLETLNLKKVQRWLMRGGLVAVFVVAYFTFYRYVNEWMDADFTRAFILQIFAMLSVFTAPFLAKRSESETFWRYCVELISRIIQNFLYFALVYIGLVLLLFAFDYFFLERALAEEYFLELWIFVVGILGTFYFMMGIPEKPNEMKNFEYPKYLKVLAQYALVPLVALYVLLLYAYTGKIVLTWDWPLGATSSWILVFLTFGLITYFLLGSAKEKFIKSSDWFKKLFFILLIPQVIVMFLALRLRIVDYGITDVRYFLVVIGSWLILMALYFIFIKKRSLQVLPISLLIVLVVSFVGPASAFNVSVNSQFNRLVFELGQVGVLVDGELVENQDLVIVNDKSGNISSMVRYLVDYGGIDEIENLLGMNFENHDLRTDEGKREVINEIMDKLGISKAYHVTNYVTFNAKEDCNHCGVEVSGYDYFYTSSFNLDYGSKKEVYLGREILEINSYADDLMILETVDGDRLRIKLDDFAQDIYDGPANEKYSANFEREEMTMDIAVGDWEGKIIFNNISGQLDGNFIELDWVNFDLLLRKT